MKTYFIEIVSNPDANLAIGSKFLAGVVSAPNKEVASLLVMDHYRGDYYHEGGQYRVQCLWEINMPTREIISKHWHKLLKSYAEIYDHDSNWNVIGVHRFETNKTKRDVLNDYDRLNIIWDDVFL